MWRLDLGLHQSFHKPHTMNTNKDRQNQSEHTTTIVNFAVVVGLIVVVVVVGTFAVAVIVVILDKFFETHTDKQTLHRFQTT